MTIKLVACYVCRCDPAQQGPVIDDGFVTVPDGPGLGIELNPDVARAHLAEGERWWGD